MKSILSTTILLFLLIGLAFSQNNQDESIVVSGKVINSETKEGVSFAHINLDDTYWGVICDSLGFFRIRMSTDQKLKVRAMGFKPQVISIQAKDTAPEIFQEIVLDQESYLLQQVDIYSFGSWNDFKEQFIKEKLPEEENVASTFDFGNLKLTQAEAKTMHHGGFGLSFGVGKGRKKFKGMKTLSPTEELHQNLLAQKYNRNIVAEITKENGKRLDILISYINARVLFSHQSSDLYIANKIKQLHKEFLNEDFDLNSQFTFADTLGKIQNHLRP